MRRTGVEWNPVTGSKLATCGELGASNCRFRICSFDISVGSQVQELLQALELGS
jgi:hypothetical protein